MPFSEEIKTRAMVACGRRCCICHKFCGNNMEVHHIKAHADGGSDDFENAIPLCFDCHAEVRQYDPRHPKGIRFSEKELIQHRDNWYASVKNPNEASQTKDAPVRIVRPKSKNVLTIRVETGQELLALTQNISAIEYGYDEPESAEEASTLASFVQELRDLVDCCDILMEPSDNITMAFEINSEIKDLEKAGYLLFCAVEERKLVGGASDPEPFPTLIIRLKRSNSDEIIRAKEQENSSL